LTLGANVPDKRPLLNEEHKARLRAAYESTQLAQNGIEFDDAITAPHYRTALENIAEARRRRESRP
jgi:hypothetical protein